MGVFMCMICSGCLLMMKDFFVSFLRILFMVMFDVVEVRMIGFFFRFFWMDVRCTVVSMYVMSV